MREKLDYYGDRRTSFKMLERFLKSAGRVEPISPVNVQETSMRPVLVEERKPGADVVLGSIKKDVGHQVFPDGGNQRKLESASPIFINLGPQVDNLIQWRYDRLARLARLTALCSQVTIKAGNETPDMGSVANLGEVLAWKRISGITDLFNKARKIGEDAVVITNFKNGKAEIRVNTEIIAQKVREQKEGVLDKVEFAKRINRVVNRGLLRIIIAEKLFQARNALARDAREAALVLPPAILGCYLLIHGSEGIRNLHKVSYYLRELTGNVSSLEVGIGVSFIALAAIISGGRLYFTKLDSPWDKDPYGESFSNYLNPLKPILDAIKARLYLSTFGNKLVEPKKQ